MRKPTISKQELVNWSREDASFYAFLATEKIRHLFPKRSNSRARATLKHWCESLRNSRLILSHA